MLSLKFYFKNNKLGGVIVHVWQVNDLVEIGGWVPQVSPPLRDLRTDSSHSDRQIGKGTPVTPMSRKARHGAPA